MCFATTVVSDVTHQVDLSMINSYPFDLERIVQNPRTIHNDDVYISDAVCFGQQYHCFCTQR